MSHDLSKETIRIGTLVSAGKVDAASYIKQILPHGFESFSLTYWQTFNGKCPKQVAKDVNKVLENEQAIISSVSMFGNPLEYDEAAEETRKGWEALIDCAELYGTNLVTGFTGRLRGKPIDENIERFKEVWTPLAERAAAKGVKIAFENCDMGGTWASGDWNIAHNPTAWELIFAAVPAENMGLQWEPCHQMVSLIDPMPQLREWVGKIFHVHGKDATIHWDVVKKYGVHGPNKFAFHRTPGFGDSNWTDIISDLRIGGFKGSIDIEGWHDPIYRGDLEMTGQVYGLNYLKQCRGGFFAENPV